MPNSELIIATDLEQWADRLDAQSVLPRLVRRLILGNTAVTEVSMRAGEGVRLPGWDGRVYARRSDAFVPEGVSRWEMGTGKDAGAKAESDYRARTANPRGVTPVSTTFVFVTPRRWRDRDTWEDAKRAEGTWGGVRVHDADGLETWLEQTPSVHVWISELLGRDPRDVESPDAWWHRWSRQTQPALPPEFLIAGRDNARDSLRSQLIAAPAVVSVVGPSREEALAFITASMVAGSDDTDLLLARTLIVRSHAAWERAVDSAVPMVLVGTFDDVDVAAAVAKGHHALVPIALDPTRPGQGIELPPIGREQAREALETVGLVRDTADQYAVHARRNLLSLRRVIGISPNLRRPGWSEPPDAQLLLPLILAGSWSADVEGDRVAIEALTGRSYIEVDADLVRWAALEDAPVQRTGQTWSVVSKEDAWTQAGSLCTADTLRRFHDVAVQVLTESDPALDLEPERRYMANILGHGRKWSSRLREGLSDTTAFLGGRVADAALADSMTGQDHADGVVRDVMASLNSDASGRAWPSLADTLPALAEASSDIFLDAVDAGFARAPAPLAAMFTDHGAQASVFGPHSPHTWLLWALETLCWSPIYLGRSAGALARLVQIDPPDSQQANRPIGSLADVFRIWLPQTGATLESRLAVVDQLCHRAPDVAWTLLNAMLPSHFAYGSPTHHPRWRDWRPEVESALNYPDIYVTIPEVLRRLLEHVGGDVGHWRDLIAHIDCVPSDSRAQIFAELEALDITQLNNDGKTMLWREMTDLANKHRRFPDAKWTMPVGDITRLEVVAERFEPTSAIDRFVGLFGHRVHVPGVDISDHAAHDQAVGRMRRDAAREILEVGGVDGLVEVAEQADLPAVVGIAAAEAGNDGVAPPIYALLGAGGARGEMARGFVAWRMESRGWDAFEQLVSGDAMAWSPEQQTGLLLAARPTHQLLGLVKAFPDAVREAYWKSVRVFWVRAEDAIEVAEQLLAHHRPWAAVSLLHLDARSADAPAGIEIPSDLIVRALTEAITTPSDEAAMAAGLMYEVGALLDRLERDGVDPGQIARLEWLYEPGLRFTRPARSLYTALGQDPDLFVEIVSYVYRPDDAPEDETATEQQVAMAERGFSVLRAWDRIPGLREDGRVDADRLRRWFSSAREKLAEIRRTKVGDGMLGEALAASPQGSDGAWPHETVRDIIEDVASPDIEHGLVIARMNQRGVTTRDPSSGGTSERGLADQYGQWAQQCADRWPRTARMLRKLQSAYAEMARREDDQSRRFGDNI